MTEARLTALVTANGDAFVGQMRNAKASVDSVRSSFAGAGAAAQTLARGAGEAAGAQRAGAAAAEQLAAAQDRVAISSTRAAQESTRASQAASRNLASTRAGFQQLGAQANDIAVQLASGTAASTVFAQQLGQVTGALGLMTAGTNASSGAVGRFLGFLGGPWGAVLTAAGIALYSFSEQIRIVPGELGTLADYAAVMWDDFMGATADAGAAVAEFVGLSSDHLDSFVGGARQVAIDLYNILTYPWRAIGAAVYAAVRTGSDLLRAFVADARQLVAPLALMAAGDFVGAARAFGSVRPGTGNFQLRTGSYFSEGMQATSAESVGEYLGTVRERANVRARERRDAEAASRRRRGARESAGRSRGSRDGEDALAEFGRDAADRIRAINEQWSETPRLVQRANAATAQLNDLLDDIRRRRPPNMERLIADIDVAKRAIQEGLLRPFREMLEQAEQQRSLQLLILQGREREAAIEERVLRLREQSGEVTEEQREEIGRIIDAEERLNDLLDKREAIIGAYTSSLGDFRASLEELFSGGSIGDFGRAIRDNARQLRGRLLSEQLFGDGFRQLEREIREQTGLEGTVDALERQVTGTTDALGRIERAANSAADALSNAPNKLPGRGRTGKSGDAAAAEDNADIVVTAPPTREAGRLTSMRPDDYFRRVAQVMTQPLAQLLRQIDDTIGTRLAGRLGGVIEGGIAGYMQAGPVGGILGALDAYGLEGRAGKLASGAFKGAQTGALVNQVGNIFGINGSSSGAALGGALGSFLPVPGGEIIGSIVGNIVGGLFKKTKTGTATITSVDGEAALGGNNRAARAAAGDVARDVQSALQQIADQLGGSVGNFAVSIGTRDGKFRVDPTGRGQTKTSRGALDFGEDGSSAVSAALADAIADGGIEGLSAAIQKALRSSTDIDKALKEALKVQEVEDLIGGIGATLERQFRQFEVQAKDRVRIATEYGFDVLKIEERNAEDRKKLVDQILSSRVGALQELLRDFRVGDLFEGTAADRRQALIAEAAKAGADAEAGVEGAAQRLADITRQLVETSREAFGTAGPEFASDRANAISAAERVIAIENDRIKRAQETAEGTRKAAEQSNVLLGEVNDQLARLIAIVEGGGAPAAFVSSQISPQIALVQRGGTP